MKDDNFKDFIEWLEEVDNFYYILDNEKFPGKRYLNEIDQATFDAVRIATRAFYEKAKEFYERK